MTDTPGRCAICGGSKEEHANSMHAYTENPGELVTREQQQKQQQLQNAPRSIVQLPAPVSPTVTDRLVRVMLDKGMINDAEALFILAGIPINSGKEET